MIFDLVGVVRKQVGGSATSMWFNHSSLVEPMNQTHANSKKGVGSR